MSIKRTTEISNYEKEADEKEKSNYFMKSISTWPSFGFPSFEFPSFDLDWFLTYWVYIFVFIWVLFSILSIRKYMNCDPKFIVLSLIPFVNIYLYFSNLCVPLIRENSNRENVNRHGIGVTMQYPTFLQSSPPQPLNNKPETISFFKRNVNKNMSNKNVSNKNVNKNASNKNASNKNANKNINKRTNEGNI